MTTSHTSAGISREAVLDVAALLPEWLETARHLRRQSGLQAAIWHDGELVAEVAVGEADLATGTPLRPTHRLRIASHSKMITAMAILRLRELGRIRLDDALGDHVGELVGTAVADRTLRDLLSHSAGLTRDSDDARWWRLGIPFPDRAQLLRIARTSAVKAEAGLHLQYSNIGYGLLGLVIEAVTGSSFTEAVEELVLAPVGVEGMGPDLPEGAAGPEVADGFAAGHTSFLHGPRRPVEQVPTRALAAATGFWASAGAIATFMGRVLTRGELLSPASLREMRRRVWTLHDGGQYGLGLQEGRLHGFAVLGHSGGFPTGLSRTWAVPTERLVVSVIGTAVDAPSSDLAEGILGLLALASGRPAPQADGWEQAGAQGGGSDGRPRPVVLAEQPEVEISAAGSGLTAHELAGVVSGTYDTLWGRTRLAVLGGRLFALDEAAADPASGTLELAVGGTRGDPIVAGAEVVELAAWGDSGYDTWAEPVLARLEVPAEGGPPRCTALVWTGQVQTPSADFAMPERVVAP
ncbi:serine hydrolase domain-containing protein [Brachybacterium sacelli]|uniref:CubicO group peptidase (Beta-lactamase class C family) n=1 Tax=Brachybacterium sacelli TaxID=173364 RepID=A0ABS4WWH1_9MICO|nr:serine hydrolase domain-containing protein [Brachybacterium sacelli]MBP2380549.1 CubicO group peptidase (beta-lactamase class C family) [Brachybacterium sacelli]